MPTKLTLYIKDEMIFYVKKYASVGILDTSKDAYHRHLDEKYSWKFSLIPI